jgi:hypothetical protein
LSKRESKRRRRRRRRRRKSRSRSRRKKEKEIKKKRERQPLNSCNIHLSTTKEIWSIQKTQEYVPTLVILL